MARVLLEEDQAQLFAAQQKYSSDDEVHTLMVAIKTLFFGEEEQPDPDSIEVPEGMTVEEAQGYIAERAAKLPPPADVLPDPMEADRLAAETTGT